MNAAEVQAMGHREVARCWNANADAWTELSRAGYDKMRDGFNTPVFLANLPEVAGLSGLDIGCGEGANTRLVAARGAAMTGIDIAHRFTYHARRFDGAGAMIRYATASAVEMPFGDGEFDFAVAFMSMMDIPENDRALREVFRVLKPGGFFQFSVLHPFIAMPHCRKVRDAEGKLCAYELAGYFSVEQPVVEEWIFSAAPEEVRRRFEPFQIPYFHHTISGWLNTVIDAGFVIERVVEPAPDDAAVQNDPGLADDRIVPWFLQVRGRKRQSIRANQVQ
jgi:ubiquinone/menaquinone biosynthesis C-methylase UbiE